MSLEAGTHSSFLDQICVAVATLFGIGRIPKIPGTVASLLTLPLVWLLLKTGFVVYITIVILLILVSIPICGRAARAIGHDDPGCVVLDEVCGMLISCFPLALKWPGLAPQFLFAGLFIAFAFFRLFDIWKPGLIRNSQSLPGGVGIVVDDVLAGNLTALMCVLAAALFSFFSVL